jgi:fatty acid desaturase
VVSASTTTTPTAAMRHEYLTPLHGVLNVLHLLATHALLIAWFWLGGWFLPLAAYLPLSLVACIIHQRAMSEWIHEGAHFNFVPNRKWNDRLTNALAGIWFALPVRVYRETHFAHHRKDAFFVADDPDTAFLELHSRGAFWRAVLSDITGLTILRQFRRFEANETKASERRVLAVAAVANLALVALAYVVGRLEAPLLYYFSLVTLYPLLNRLRTYAQHVTIEASGSVVFAGSKASRTIDAGLFDRIVHTSPLLMNHHEHHLNPHLPYRALRHLVEPTEDRNRYAKSRWSVLQSIYVGLPR